MWWKSKGQNSTETIHSWGDPRGQRLVPHSFRGTLGTLWMLSNLLPEKCMIRLQFQDTAKNILGGDALPMPPTPGLLLSQCPSFLGLLLSNNNPMKVSLRERRKGRRPGGGDLIAETQIIWRRKGKWSFFSFSFFQWTACYQALAKQSSQRLFPGLSKDALFQSSTLHHYLNGELPTVLGKNKTKQNTQQTKQ